MSYPTAPSPQNLRQYVSLTGEAGTIDDMCRSAKAGTFAPHAVLLDVRPLDQIQYRIKDAYENGIVLAKPQKFSQYPASALVQVPDVSKLEADVAAYVRSHDKLFAFRTDQDTVMLSSEMPHWELFAQSREGDSFIILYTTHGAVAQVEHKHAEIGRPSYSFAQAVSKRLQPLYVPPAVTPQSTSAPEPRTRVWRKGMPEVRKIDFTRS